MWSLEALGNVFFFQCHFLLGGMELRFACKFTILVDFESYEIWMLDDMKKVKTEMKPLDCGG